MSLQSTENAQAISPWSKHNLIET